MRRAEAEVVAYEGTWMPRRCIQVPVAAPAEPVKWTEYDEARQIYHRARGREELARWTARRRRKQEERLQWLMTYQESLAKQQAWVHDEIRGCLAALREESRGERAIE